MQQQIPNNSGVVKETISLKEVILSVRAWWRYMVSKWKLVVLVGVVGGILGLVYSLLTQAKYKAEASFVLEGSKSDGGVMSIAAKFGLSSSSSGEGLFGDEDNMIVFLKSRTMISQTLLTPISFNGKNQLLIDRYLAINKFREKWKSEKLKNVSFKPYPEPNTLLADSLITVMYKSVLKKNLSVAKPDKDGNIINVATVSQDELFSKALTDHLIENATMFYVKVMTKKSLENVSVLQHQADSIKDLLNRAISGAAASNDQVPNLNPAYQRLKVPSQKKIVDVEMNKAILEELVKNLELAKINLRQETPLIQVIDLPVLPLEKIATGKLKGIVLGVFWGVFLALFYFTLRHAFKIILNK